MLKLTDKPHLIFNTISDLVESKQRVQTDSLNAKTASTDKMFFKIK